MTMSALWVWVMIFTTVTMRVVVNDIHDFDVLVLVHKIVRGGNADIRILLWGIENVSGCVYYVLHSIIPPTWRF